jgi:3-aminobutyryl-CoA ammonia-lyase
MSQKQSGGGEALPEAFLRIRFGHEEAHYASHLLAGAKMLEVFGDLATELTVKHDGEKGLLRAYESVELFAPVYARDWIEAKARIVEVGKSSRKFECEAYKVIADTGSLTANVMDPPVLVARATGTIIAMSRHKA